MSENQQFKIPNGEKLDSGAHVSLHAANPNLISLDIVEAAREAYRAAALTPGEKLDIAQTPQEKMSHWGHNLYVARKKEAEGSLDLESEELPSDFDVTAPSHESLRFIEIAHQEHKGAAQSDFDLAA